MDSIPPKTENSNLYGFELHRPSIKCTKLLFQVIKVTIIFDKAHRKGSQKQWPCSHISCPGLLLWAPLARTLGAQELQPNLTTIRYKPYNPYNPTYTTNPTYPTILRQPCNPITLHAYVPTLHTLQPYYCAVRSCFALVEYCALRINWRFREILLSVERIVKKGRMLNVPTNCNASRLHKGWNDNFENLGSKCSVLMRGWKRDSGQGQFTTHIGLS